MKFVIRKSNDISRSKTDVPHIDGCAKLHELAWLSYLCFKRHAFCYEFIKSHFSS